MSAAPNSPRATPAPAAPLASAPPDVPKRPFLERMGLRYFRALSARSGKVTADDAVHLLNPRERAALKRISRANVARAALAGALSALAAAVADRLAQPLLGPHPEVATVAQQVRFWSVVGGVTVVASVVEILFLYWDALRSVHALSVAAGVPLFEGEDPEEAVAAGLARAALELPNPPEPLFGVDPRREASKVKLLVSSLAYKAKIGVSNFILKALVRRMMGRVVVRAWLEFVSIPVTALWNALVAAQVMREARIRAMGPSAVIELVRVIFASAPPLSQAAKDGVFRAVASAIVRTTDLHPNLARLLAEVGAKIGAPVREAPDDTFRFLEDLARLSPEEQRVVLRTLAVAAIIDGRLNEPEKRLLAAALKACGRNADLAPVLALRKRFVAGEAIPPEALESL